MKRKVRKKKNEEAGAAGWRQHRHKDRFEGYLPRRASEAPTSTTDVDAYIAAWDALTQPISAATGWRRHGFDPGITFLDQRGKPLHMTTDQAYDLIAALGRK